MDPVANLVSTFTVQDLTAGALLGLLILLILMGRLVPRSTLTLVGKEAERWRETAEIERESRERLQESLHAQSQELSATAIHQMEAFRELAEERQKKQPPHQGGDSET